MFKKFLQAVSFLLIIALLTGLLPMQIFAAQYRESLSATDNATLVTEEPLTVLSEIPEERTEFSKEFLMSNGLHMAVVYGDSIHYEKDGVWQDIDNTLIARADGTYVNTAGIWDVAFAQQAGSGNAVTITKDGYTLSFGLPQKMTAGGSTPGLEVMSTDSTQTLSTVQAATVTAQVETTVDASDVKASADHPETVLEKLSSRMTYSGVHTDTNVVYDLSGNRVKESVVIAKYDSTLRGYRYTLNTGSLIPRLQDDGSIHFYDSTETNVVMAMEAPYLLDAAMESSRDIQVDLTGTGGKYVLTYTLPTSWLAAEDRQWPVILDPEVVSNLSRANIVDVMVFSNGKVYPSKGFLDMGREGSIIKRSYVRYENLPTIGSADMIVSAKMCMWQMYYRSVSVPAQVHKVLEDWEDTTITWNAQPAYDETITDFVRGHDAEEYQWDITDIVQDWYTTGENYGLLFRSSDRVETRSTTRFRQFYSSDYGLIYRPTLIITFRNTNGLESHWDYASASAGRAGTGYVNTYTGNLVFTRPLLGFGGNRMPVSVGLTYNANDTFPNEYYVEKGLGYGWRTNLNQRIYKWTADLDGDGTVEDSEYYYAWEDGDGTTHYFENVSTGVYTDEDGLGLTLNTSGSDTSMTWTITDKGDNVSYFDTQGRLYKQENNQEEKSSIQITYTADDSYRISTVTDGAGRVYRFTYTDGLLTRVGYYGSTATEISGVSLAYENGELTRITDPDGKSTTYTYNQIPEDPATETETDTGESTDFNRHMLIKAADVDGYELLYTYYAQDSDFAPARVASAQEKDGTALGSMLSFSYGQNQTVLTSLYPDSDGIYHAENTLTYQFNSHGNTVSVQDDQGRAQYSTFGWENSANGAKGNQLTLSSKLQNTVSNLLTDSSFESSTLWTPDLATPTMTYSIASSGYLGSKSMQIAGCSAEFLCSPTFTVGAGETYTFSGYVKTTAGTAKLGIRNQDVQEDAVYSDAVSTDGEWVRVQVSYTNDTESAKTLYACFMGLENATAMIDCVQLEKAPTASRYNLVNNGDFRNGTTGWTTYGAGAVATVDPAAPQLDGTAYRITGDYTGTYTLTQTIAVSGSAKDAFVFSGWAKGRTAALEGLLNGMDKQYSLRFTFNNTDGTTTVKTVSFNHNIADWQYVAAAAVAEKAYSSVTIQIRYVTNANTVYFDGIQLFKEAFGTSYAYDDDGNVKRVTDIQGKETSYEYTNNDLTEMTLPDGTVLTYDYDDRHNVTKATSAEGMVYEFEYDDYGNNTKVSIVSGDVTISSTAAYSTDGNRLVSVTDALGNTTTYDYDSNTNVLNWVQYPEDTPATRTNYTYDNMYRMATAAATTDSNLSMSASYTYTDDYLTKIQTPTTTYNFSYGDFGLRSSVIVGDPQNPEHVLAEYYYDSYNRLEELDYGNQDSVQYTYDTQGRVIQELYEDGATVTYSYDNTGALATVTDSETGITTTYYYDLINRLVKYEEKGTNFTHSVTYIYDEKNNLSSLTEVINGVKTVYSYAYDDDNRVTSVSVGNGTTTISTVSYTYDAFGRMSQQVTKHGDSTSGTTVLTESATFNPGNTENSTSGQIASYNGFTYTYDDNGNITSVTYGGKTTTYEYDSANQLIRENNQALGKTWRWTYDAAGNIQSREEYDYTLLDDPSDLNHTTIQYGYDEEGAWGDLLLSYGSMGIEYDAIGNPTKLGDWSMEWQHGRQLASMTDGTTNWNYTYNSDGLRTKRTNGTTTYNYVYNGSQLAQMTVGSNTLTFAYDAAGIPLTVTHNGTVYYYSTNVQGDIIAILNSSGTAVVTYTYDAWGNPGTVGGTLASTLGALNPLRYRGYVYDTETGLYYLQSRYYDPEIGRFINADDIAYLGAGSSFISLNLFAYCGNNPVLGYDPLGHWDWGGVLMGLGIIAATVITVASFGVATPLGAIVAGAAIATGTVMTYAAATDTPMVVDVSLSVPTGMDTYTKVGVSMIIDFKQDEAHLYGHVGRGRGLGGGVSYSVGLVANYDDPKDYEKHFVDVNAASNVGFDHCWNPEETYETATQATCVTFSPGLSYGSGYDYYLPAMKILAWGG